MRDRRFEILEQGDVFERMQRMIRDADHQVVCSVPQSVLPDLVDDLRDAVARGTLVLCCLVGGDDPTRTVPDDLATVVRWFRTPGAPTMCLVDYEVGVVSYGDMLLRSSDDHAVYFVEEYLEHMAFTSFMEILWSNAAEVRVADPHPLPRTYEVFRQAVIEATAHLRDRRVVYATMDVIPTDGGPPRVLTGQVIDTRQDILQPDTATFTGENSLVVRVDDEMVSVGGPSAFLEDFEAHTVTLRASPETGRSRHIGPF